MNKFRHSVEISDLLHTIIGFATHCDMRTLFKFNRFNLYPLNCGTATIFVEMPKLFTVCSISARQG